MLLYHLQRLIPVSYTHLIDETALKWPKIAISAGVRGEQILLAPQDLIKAVNATVADLIK